MTLSDMAEYVCGKVRRTDAASVTRCKGFLKARHEMAYNDQLWKASLYLHTFQMPKTTTLDYEPNQTSVNEEGMYFMPELVDRVLAVRRADTQLNVTDELTLFRGSVDRFSEQGDGLEFAVLSPAVFWVPAPNLEEQTLRFVTGDTTTDITVRWIDSQDQEHTTTGKANEHLFIITEEAGPRLIESITHAAMGENLNLEWDESAAATWGSVARSIAGSTGFVPRQRIRVYPKPGNSAAAVNFTALVKRKVRSLTLDGDVSQLPGLDNCLMAFAQADMLQHDRQYGKAQVVQQEALALFEQFKRLEVAQQADNMRFIPDVGEVPGEWDSTAGGKGHW
jgi:hypothetical protein